MKKIISPRQSGKTTRMIAWLIEDNKRALITFNAQERERLRKEFPEMANRIHDWHSYHQSSGMMATMETKKVAIDNADMVLEYLVRHPIDVITMSSDVEDEQ